MSTDLATPPLDHSSLARDASPSVATDVATAVFTHGSDASAVTIFGAEPVEAPQSIAYFDDFASSRQDDALLTFAANSDLISATDSRPSFATDSVSISATNSVSIRAGSKPRMTFATAATRVIEYGEGLKDLKIPLSKLRVAGSRIFAHGREFILEARGVRHLCGHLHAPADYLESLDEKLRDQLLAYHLGSAGRDRGKLNDSNCRLLYRDDTFVGLGRADLLTLSVKDVFNAVRDGFGSDADSFEVQNLKIEADEESFIIDIVSTKVATEVRPDDLIEAGVRLEHSFMSERATTVLPYVVRRICANGMTRRYCVGNIKKPQRTRRLNAKHEGAAISQSKQICSLTKEAKNGLEATLDAIKKLADKPAKLPELGLFLRQARMHSAGLGKQLNHSWEIEGSENTAFGLFNALTRLATHGSDLDFLDSHPNVAPLSQRQMAILTRLAGIYANSSTHICEKCFSVLHKPAGD